MTTNPALFCPIRGQLKIHAKSKDGLKFSEEKRRIDCVNFLLSKGYPKDHFKLETTLWKFGNQGRNSFRTDIVVFSIARNEADKLSLEKQREHIVLISEIKRDSADAEGAVATQVKPALGFLPDLNSIGLYWDDINQTVFYKEIVGTKQKIIEAPITYLPDYGARLKLDQLKFSDLRESNNLTGLFKKIEDVLHQFISDKTERFEIMLQLILVKMFDEEANKSTKGTLAIQDFTLFELTDKEVAAIFKDMLSRSLNVFQAYLPRPVSQNIKIPGSALREISRLLAPINLLNSSPEVIQDFYMFFAKALYKWDLAQYFTPYEVVDFIVRITNPRHGDTVKDPACGSADFLISALRNGKPFDEKIGDRIWGADNSTNAVQISVLNMLLNGDGKSNIKEEDSLEYVDSYVDQFSIMLCNPPFGVRILERRSEVLSKYDLGRGKPYQQTGILFSELCVKEAKPGGRIAIILPNGYLGNRSSTYVEFREWLLKHVKIAAVIGFPRFTFKKAGADVSASVLILEKRNRSLPNIDKSEEYPVYVNLLDSVGWDIGNKKSMKLYRRDPETGAFSLNADNKRILDAGFEEVLADLYQSPVISAFPWISDGKRNANIDSGWSVSAKEITQNKELILDPKRLCRKFIELQQQISAFSSVRIQDICDILPEEGFRKSNSKEYKYVEVGDVHSGSYEYATLRGWELPSRAKLLAEKGDIFVGSIWGSVKKWFMAGEEAAEENLVVTNGFHRLRMKTGKEAYLPELVAAFCSEYYRVQARALATGSDGLAEITPDDYGRILIPKIKNDKFKKELAKQIENRMNSRTYQKPVLEELPGELKKFDIPERPSVFAQV